MSLVEYIPCPDHADVRRFKATFRGTYDYVGESKYKDCTHCQYCKEPLPLARPMMRTCVPCHEREINGLNVFRCTECKYRYRGYLEDYYEVYVEPLKHQPVKKAIQ